ncbi:MAG: iron ABC transporter permease [Deltaproteobacteria bacterium]|nr:iron ABC transporter permease [Deltaproteobacteria bacterium]
MTGLRAWRFAAWFAGGLGLWLAAIALAPLVGPERASFGEAWSAIWGATAIGPSFDIILLQRLPRVLLGALAGGALAVAGAAFQAVLRNPLAEPYTLGVASSGALGALAVMSFGLSASFGPFSSVQIGALAGAGANVLLVSALGRRRGAGGGNGMLLAGIAVSLISAALMMLVRYLSSPHRMVEMDRWLMGGLDVTGFDAVAGVVPLLLPGLAAVVLHARAIDQLLLGPAMAEGRGVDVDACRRDVFLGGSLATAAVVAVTGPIGFVGLIVPHAVRRFAPRDHRVILPVSFFAGGAFLVLADTVARIVAAPAEIPVGILTAAVGGPIFLVILARGRASRE